MGSNLNFKNVGNDSRVEGGGGRRMPNSFSLMRQLSERLTKNKADQDKVKYPSVQGTKSFSATRNDQYILIEVREIQQTQVASNGASVEELAIAKEVFREQRGHVHRITWILKGRSLSLDLTVASNAPRRTSNQLSEDARNNDLQFAMYEAQLH
ncbi:Uncharacterized protein Adt_27059 [Abeliophyllum distichum]|uniref:Uncharacterized protein n=1 Tax=Abeliophyllum distichum TaxID=126358 RepID=A0ABD1RTC1_9LAMI